MSAAPSKEAQALVADLAAGLDTAMSRLFVLMLHMNADQKAAAAKQLNLSDDSENSIRSYESNLRLLVRAMQFKEGPFGFLESTTSANQESSTPSANLAFATVPDVTLPNGIVVPSFKVGKFLCGADQDDAIVINATTPPRVRVTHAEARTICSAIGGQLITELQYLAIAHDIASQDINWTGGQVGKGKVFQGLHLGTFDSAQAGTVESPHKEERRWHQLSNGELVYDFAGNAYSWVFDDVQGDANGIIARPFAAVSPSISTAPFPSMEKGMGWRPDIGANWSGRALVRGGYWYDEGNAGVFGLGVGWPDLRDDLVGFRCTK